MICQGCGKKIADNAMRHTYYQCLAWIRWHPEDYKNVTHKHLYYGKKRVADKKTEEKSERMSYVEFTLQVPCFVGCKKFCPQDVLSEVYQGASYMDFEGFKQILGNIPKSVPIVVGGLTEPFQNDGCIDFIEFAYEQGYAISVFTTLVGTTKNEVERLSNISFRSFRLHLPDGKVMKMPKGEVYKDNVFWVLTHVENVDFAIMNKNFFSVNRENLARGILPNPKRVGYCVKLKYPQPVVFPNGEVYLCCMDYGLKHRVGNLLTDSFEEIVDVIRKGKFDLCFYCVWNISWVRWFGRFLLKILVERFGRGFP